MHVPCESWLPRKDVRQLGLATFRVYPLFELELVSFGLLLLKALAFFLIAVFFAFAPLAKSILLHFLSSIVLASALESSGLFLLFDAAEIHVSSFGSCL